MASLVKLPVETLHRIGHFLARLSTESLRNLCLANKTFNQICSPWLIYRWGNSQECAEPGIERFVMHLFRRPELRKKVKSLSIGYALAVGVSDLWHVNLDREILRALAQAAASDIKMEPEYLTSLCSDIERGYSDALNVLLLAWCTGVTHLSITIPPFELLDGEHSHVLTFTKQAILRLLPDEASAEELPLGEVRHFELHHSYKDHPVFFEIPFVFFHLPKIKSLVTSGLCDHHSYLASRRPNCDGSIGPLWFDYASRYAMSLPDASSNIEELEFANFRLTRAGLPTLLLGIRNLKKLALHPYRDPEGIDPEEDRLWISEHLEICQDSLEEIDLQTEPPGDILDPDTLRLEHGRVYDKIREVTKDQYEKFINLRRLSCPMTDLLEVVRLDVVPGRLPKTIEYLKPHCYDLVANWDSKDRHLEPYIEGFIRMLKEAGPGHRLCNLKILDLSDAFLDDAERADIRRLKDLAADLGVRLLLK
ncbi:hypothetical protein FSPOR_8252 [Fusarium sporotrichioides]|uniref:F-box domain-containing protein n=1 Tax=Fusarium sporotrichioides TaxID=5514 RepID=A0A395RUY2_FUSSP|nr:hypothetical protein FSPOR_8252 [Fusarium sporotrichioides]